MVEVAADGRHHAVLQEQLANGVEPLAVLLLERQEIADLVVAIGDVDAHVVVEHVAFDEPQLARIGMHELDAALLAEVLDEMRLLVGTFGDVLRLDERQAPGRAADRARVIEQHLQEQIALIARRVDREQRIVARQRRHDVAHDERLCERTQVDAADAREIRLHELERVLPARAREVADGVEPSVERRLSVRDGRPHLVEPCALVVGQRQGGAHVGVTRIELGEARERAHDPRANVMQIAELLGHYEQRPQHDAHGFDRAVMDIDDVARARVFREPPRDVHERGIRDEVDGLAHARIERGAREPELLGGRQHRAARLIGAVARSRFRAP